MIQKTRKVGCHWVEKTVREMRPIVLFLKLTTIEAMFRYYLVCLVDRCHKLEAAQERRPPDRVNLLEPEQLYGRKSPHCC